jgi:hypothetical protein
MVKKKTKVFFNYSQRYTLLQKNFKKHKIKRLQPFILFKHMLFKPNYYYLGIFSKFTFFYTV